MIITYFSGVKGEARTARFVSDYLPLFTLAALIYIAMINVRNKGSTMTCNRRLKTNKKKR